MMRFAFEKASWHLAGDGLGRGPDKKPWAQAGGGWTSTGATGGPWLRLGRGGHGEKRRRGPRARFLLASEPLDPGDRRDCGKTKSRSGAGLLMADWSWLGVELRCPRGGRGSSSQGAAWKALPLTRQSEPLMELGRERLPHWRQVEASNPPSLKQCESRRGRSAGGPGGNTGVLLGAARGTAARKGGTRGATAWAGAPHVPVVSVHASCTRTQ